MKGKKNMNGLTIVYIIGALAVGFLIGLFVELMMDAGTISELQDENRRLRLWNEQLVEDLEKHPGPEVVEIYDKAVEPQNIPDYTGNF